MFKPCVDHEEWAWLGEQLPSHLRAPLLKRGRIVFIDDTQPPGVRRRFLRRGTWTGSRRIEERKAFTNGSFFGPDAFLRPYADFVDF